MTYLSGFARHSVTRRVCEAIATLLGVTILTFVLLRIVPGNQITAQYGTAAGNLTHAQIQSLEAYYGLNKPPVVQYFDWLGGLFTGNFGFDVTSRQSVLSMTAQALPNTIELAVLSIIVGLTLGVPGGLFAASRPGRLRDHSTQLVSLIALSVPSFLLATAVSTWLADKLNWDPNGLGYVTLGANPGLNLEQMLLPALVLGISIAPPVLQTTRASVLAIRAEDYVRTARAKGLRERRVLLRHVLRNSMVTFVSLFGLDFGALVGGGAILTEVVFGIHGIGFLTYEALTNLDLPTIMATVVFGAFFIVLANAVVDVGYAWLDPRVRPT